ncbi:MAG: hypothetical protein GY928_37450 [Colwellia sp.]|nr:hypothetical protein [Colwellia sp.]
MQKQKCDDCITKPSWTKILGVIIFSSSTLIATGVFIKTLMDVVETVAKVEKKVDIIYAYMYQNGDITAPLIPSDFTALNVDNVTTVAKIESRDIIKYPPQKRITNSETAFDNEDFETKILD